jgi:hypothetical protein
VVSSLLSQLFQLTGPHWVPSLRSSQVPRWLSGLQLTRWHSRGRKKAGKPIKAYESIAFIRVNFLLSFPLGRCTEHFCYQGLELSSPREAGMLSLYLYTLLTQIKLWLCDQGKSTRWRLRRPAAHKVCLTFTHRTKAVDILSHSTGDQCVMMTFFYWHVQKTLKRKESFLKIFFSLLNS